MMAAFDSFIGSFKLMVGPKTSHITLEDGKGTDVAVAMVSKY
jgi:hypothetical protein